MKNLNDLAKEIAECEGKKVEVNIAQIKEIIHVLCVEMYLDPSIAIAMIHKGQKSSWKRIASVELPEIGKDEAPKKTKLRKKK